MDLRAKGSVSSRLTRVSTLVCLGFCVLFLTASGKMSAADANTKAMEARILEDLTYLSSDDLAGRGVGSEGIAKAAEFIAQRFQQLGLKTDAFNGAPYQRFSIPGPTTIGPPESNRCKVLIQNNAPSELKLGTQFTPLSIGKNGAFKSQVVFAGYGITAPDYAYDDYAGLDVTGKVVIVLRKEPQQKLATSRFEGTNNSQYAFFTTKELNAAVHKAAAVLMVNDFVTASQAATKAQQDLQRVEKALAEHLSKPKPADATEAARYESRARAMQQEIELFKKALAIGGEDALIGMSEAGTAISDERIPTMFISRSVADQMIRAGSGKSLKDLEEAIDREGAPHSQVLDGVEVDGQVELMAPGTPVQNVIGMLPGAGPLAEEYVVVGAHYDHVGMGGRGSLAPGTIAVHNGADDNGSGTVTMLEVARQLSSLTGGNRRTILFMAFTAEESGLLGSQHYVRNPRWALDKTVAMINLDMVGRLSQDELFVYGTGTASEFPAQIDRLSNRYNLRSVKIPQGRGASDHASFYNANIPVYHLFTGLHNDYHRPSDDVEKVNPEGMARIGQFVADIAREIAENPQRPTYQSIRGSAAPRQQSQLQAANQNAQPAGRPRMGIRIATEANQPVVITMVDPAGNGATAGLKAEDLITAVANTPTPNVQAFRDVMSKQKVGETVPVTIIRGTESFTVSVRLSE